MLTIILTSYNRPYFVRRAIESIQGQIDDDWRLVIRDDGSDEALVDYLMSVAEGDSRISAYSRPVPDAERQAKTRYSVLINKVLDTLSGGIVGYMCDNVEYAPDLVGTVNRWFAGSPARFAGYVRHSRDVYAADGTYRGTARQFRHWNVTPPVERPISAPNGLLDHSQVFHRLPTPARWEEGIHALKSGDGIFFSRLVDYHGPILPMRPGVALTQEHLII